VSRPSFQFYHGDWAANAKLRFCTKDEKGHWIDIMCVMADSDEFGIIRRPLKDVCEAVGGKMTALRALVDKRVLKGAERGERCAAFVYTPRSGRKDGVPVVLVPEQDGPIWYSSKMVRDDYIARARAEYARTHVGEKTTPKHAPKVGNGAASIPGQSDLPPSSSPSSTSVRSSKALSGKPDVAPELHVNGQHAKAVEVLQYLNTVTGSHFRNGDANIKYVKARLKEGYSVERLKEIALLKAEQWGKDEKMAEYLRPKTLFSKDNCAQYDGVLPNGVDDAPVSEMPR
jgi:uncharacterized phage protein (TIGR02220 family)